MKILSIVGARPEFIQAAPVSLALRGEHREILVHTGQHYDANMSQVFFDELELPRPDVNLEVGSGSHAVQTAEVMVRFEPVLLEYKPDWVLVPGDVNSTLACTLVACKLGFKVAHVEAGLRSFDRTMPEEINRLVTDQLADLLFTPSRDGDENLLREGIPADKIRFVGNLMIDTLVQLLPKSEERWPGLQERFGLRRFLLVTLHRPSNVDDPVTLSHIMAALTEISHQIQVVFPVHPRTRQRISSLNLDLPADNLLLTEALGYLDFLALEAQASLVLTDSGGVQEETTFLGVPCLTARANTERPVTLTAGTNRLVASEKMVLVKEITAALNDAVSTRARPDLWDGMSATRIIETLLAV